MDDGDELWASVGAAAAGVALHDFDADDWLHEASELDTMFRE